MSDLLPGQKIQRLVTEAVREAYDKGRDSERERILKMLIRYFELTQEPNEDGPVTDNPEWDKGFQAAMALIKGNP